MMETKAHKSLRKSTHAIQHLLAKVPEKENREGRKEINREITLASL